MQERRIVSERGSSISPAAGGIEKMRGTSRSLNASMLVRRFENHRREIYNNGGQ
jgi:hypothetical protein